MRREIAVTMGLVLVLAGAIPAYARLFVDDAWRGRFLAAGVLALVLAAGARRLRLGAPGAAVVSVLGLVLFTYITALPSVGLIPDATSWATFRDLLAEAAAGMRDEVAPVAAVAPFVVAIATATWVVAHVSHELAVRWRRPGLGLVPLLVLWSVPLAIPVEGVVTGSTFLRALPFLAAAGVVLLVGTDHGGDEEGPLVTVSGVTIGAAALAITAVTPLLLPGYGAAAWFDLSGPNDPRGYQPIVDVSERLQLPDERDVLRIRASERTYLRLAGLDSFDGATWRLGPSGVGSYQPDATSLHPADRPLPPEQQAISAVPTRVEVEVLDLANIYVPTPYQPVSIQGELTREMVWSTEGGFLATWNLAEGGDAGQPRVAVSEGVSYAVDAERPAPVIDDVRAVSYDQETLTRWTALPRDYDRLAEAATSVYEAAGAETAVDKALALQAWFTEDGRFTYDLDVPALRGDDALERFVLEDRVGYCEYYATAMAVMLRATGVPARVAVGFLPGSVTEPADPDVEGSLTEFTVTTADAHAWVEVLFPDHGWVTFEPTPRSDLTVIVPTEEDLAPVENLRERRARELGDLAGEVEDTETADVPDPVPAPQPEAGQEQPSGDGATGGDEQQARWPWLLLLVAVGGVALVLGRRRVASGPRGVTPDARVLAAQRDLLADARRLGVGRADHETTREVVHRWRDEGRVTGDVDRFATLAQAAAFGGEVDEAVAVEAEALVAALEDELRASVSAGDRALAPIRVPLEVGMSGIRRAGAAVTTRRGRPTDRA
jgi:transglutaminase-like putative cysteine protease